MRKLVLVMALTLSLYSATLSTGGSSISASSMFSQSSVSLGVKLGSASIGNENYTIAGISGNYFVIENLSVGLGYEKWFSGTPSIQKLTAETTYFIPVAEKVRPYVGLLYRRVLISDGFDDTNAYGYRAGIALVQNNLLLSAGIVQEKYDTKRGIFDDTETYGEFTIGFAF